MMDQNLIFILIAAAVAAAVALLGSLYRLRTRRENRALFNQYAKKEVFLTAQEARFMAALHEVVGDKFEIFSKIRLTDVFEVTARNPSKHTAAWNKISQKHLDFLLCKPETYEPILAIEIDDSSHQRKSRVERDVFFNQLFDAPGFCLLRLTAKAVWDPVELKDAIVESLRPKPEKKNGK